MAERGSLNRELPRARLDAQPWEPAARRLLDQAVDRLGLTGRGWERVRRVSRTLADLAGEEEIGEARVAEALGYRGGL